jgi:hypothetical protein
MNTFHTMLFRLSAPGWPENENSLQNPSDLLLMGALMLAVMQVVSGVELFLLELS